MLDKRIQLGLTSCTLLALSACGTTPTTATPQVAVTVTGQTEATFISTDPLVFTHARPGTFTTIHAAGDNGDYALRLDIATPIAPGSYSHSAGLSGGDPASQQFRAELYTCGNQPGCRYVAGSSGGNFDITRADDVISGTVTLTLEDLDEGDFGSGTATFTVPPALVVP